jgi:hypothetical protein
VNVKQAFADGLTACAIVLLLAAVMLDGGDVDEWLDAVGR